MKHDAVIMRASWAFGDFKKLTTQVNEITQLEQKYEHATKTYLTQDRALMIENDAINKKDVIIVDIFKDTDVVIFLTQIDSEFHVYSIIEGTDAMFILLPLKAVVSNSEAKITKIVDDLHNVWDLPLNPDIHIETLLITLTSIAVSAFELVITNGS